MAKKEIKDIASSVKARLTAKAKERTEDVQSVLVRYGVERFLYRLSISLRILRSTPKKKQNAPCLWCNATFSIDKCHLSPHP